MTNREMMLSSLKTHTIPLLHQRGFAGKYPNFRCVRNDCIELISFQDNKWGGAFTVEVSVAFPASEKPNFSLYDGMTIETLDVTATNERYRLPGMFDGWFYYSDVYQKRTLLFGRIYHSIDKKEVDTFSPPCGYKLVQKFSDTIAEEICDEINCQLEKAFVWMEKFKKRR
jgi:hypothetical protein